MRLIVSTTLLALVLHSPADTDQATAGAAHAESVKSDLGSPVKGGEDEPGVIEPGVIEKVLKSVRENYQPLRAVKARMRAEIISNFKSDGPPANVAPPPAAPNAGPNAQGTLKVYHTPSMLFEWTAELAGENQRYDILGPRGREIISADATGVTKHTPTTGEATIVPWSRLGISGTLQYDPREAAFTSMVERLSHILTSGQITAARFVELSDDETIAEIRAASVLGGNSVIECSSRFNFLPTRVSHVLDDGRLNSFTEVEYQQVQSNPTPIWFLKSAVRRNSFPYNNTSPDDKDWGQVTTIAVLDLETDATPPPPRDDSQSLPAGTQVTDQMPRPPPPAAPIAPLFSRNTVLLGVALTVVIIGIAVALAVSKMRSSDA
jgi:hypothetical protein